MSERMNRGSTERRNDPTAPYERLIVRLVSRHRPFAMEWEDACQEARIAAFLAIREYDPGMGAKESTWVSVKVLGRLKDLAKRVENRVRPQLEVPLPDTIAVAFDPTPTLSLALCEAVMRAYPPPPRVRDAISCVCADVSLREGARALGLGQTALDTQLRAWRERVRRTHPELYQWEG